MKKAYTLLEILIVVIILALMIGVFWFYLPNRWDEQIKHGKECSSYIYNEIKNKVNNIKTNKWVNIPGWRWWTLCYTKELILSTLNDWNIEISISCDKAGLPLIEEYLTTSQLKCNTDIDNKNKYFIKTTSTWWAIVLNNNLKILDLFNKTNSDLTTNVCTDPSESNSCIPISKIIFNQASKKLEQKLCLDFTWSTCNEWEQ